MKLRILPFVLATLALAGCSVVPEAERQRPDVPIQSAQAPAPPPEITLPAEKPKPEIFAFEGELTQGGWVRGQAPWRTVSARLGDQALVLDGERRFFAAFDRDAGPVATLYATLEGGRTIERALAIAPRDWNIEHVNVARRPGGATEAFLRIRRPELAQIVAARDFDAQSEGWSQDFLWPVQGRISGRFGSQRIYRGGEAGSYHSGLDIATGESGTAFISPADGVVTLATAAPFSLEGNLLIIDHGMGLNSAFLHLSKIAVSEGDRVRRGQYVGNIGASGRATGPHLHWSLKWRDARLDPLLFVGPM